MGGKVLVAQGLLSSDQAEFTRRNSPRLAKLRTAWARSLPSRTSADSTTATDERAMIHDFEHGVIDLTSQSNTASECWI